MVPYATDIFEIWNNLGNVLVIGDKGICDVIQEQTLKLDFVCNNLLQSIQKEINYEPKKKISKGQSKVQNKQIGDLFSAEPSFQQPALPPIRRTKRQASMIAMEKIKNVRESTAISSGRCTRASRARGLSTLINSPIANSTFVVDKKLLENIDQCASPQMFTSKNEITYIKTTKKNNDKICSITKKSPINIENSDQSASKFDSKTKRKSQRINKQREKLENIDVNNVEEPPAQHLTRTLKRKLQEDHIGTKKKNVNQVSLEQQLSTPLESLECLSQNLHQVKQNEAEKRKENYLKSKSDQRKFENQQLKFGKHKEENLKLLQEKIKKKEEEWKKREEKLKEKELMIKEEAIKKQKQAELRLAEMNAKRQLAEEARLLKIQQIEKNRLKLKDDETKKKTVLKLEKSQSIHPKTQISNLPIPSVPKGATLAKLKTGINKNDYGLNDVSARDSSDDESGPKKPVPIWAKKENRKSVLELQYYVNSKERDLFFDCPKSMSLKEMFKGWKIRDKLRTSSAVWNTPPRYSEYIRRYN